jgi:predicted nucleotidyltransferase
MDVWNFLEDGLGIKIDLVPEKDLREEIRGRVLAEVRYVEIFTYPRSRNLSNNC